MTKAYIKPEHHVIERPRTAEKAVDWVKNNRDTAVSVGGTVLLAVILGLYAGFRYSEVRSKSWERLALAEAYAYANRADLTLKEIGDLRQQSPTSPAAQFASLLEGDLMYREGKFKEAVEAYRRILDAGSSAKLAPFAQAGLASAQEAGGLAAEAVVSYRRFLEQNPDHFLAPEMQMALARTLTSMGEKDQAKSAYETVARLYPGSPWASQAQEKLKP